jgi:cysteine synthase
VIDLRIDEETLAGVVSLAAEREIVIPTLAQMRDPSLVPWGTVSTLRGIGLWDVHPANLFRITWHNQPVETGGGFGPVNLVEFPPAITGVDARIIALVGRWFPTGAHKVGAAFGCLVPRLVTGGFDPRTQKAVWPSTGNYCRGGAYDSALLGCESIAILPEGMSRERFEWLEGIAGRVVRTPGSESNVKEIFDACWELRRSGEDVVIFNQFDEFGNYLWHYSVTGPAMLEAFEASGASNVAGVVLATGSAGTLAAGDFVKQWHPGAMIAAAEARQCPTLLLNGYGEHRIEGIGDKHVPWIHNVRNTDMVIAVDDAAALSVFRLFNEPEGAEMLTAEGVDPGLVESLHLVGISGAANLLASIEFSRARSLGGDDVVLTVLTDSSDMYRSRLQEMNEAEGPFTPAAAASALRTDLLGRTVGIFAELDDLGRRRIHNLKYFTWVEQQGKDVAELDAQWDPGYWTAVQGQAPEVDRLIEQFNAAVAGAG